MNSKTSYTMMDSMRFLKSIKKYWPDSVFLALVILFAVLYFVVYMTPGKAAWYRSMYKEARVVLHGLVNLI